MRRSCVCVALTLLGEAASAQSPTPGGMPPPGMSLAESAATRFPQPVRVGDLLYRDVLEPLESQVLLGTIQLVVRNSHGTVEVVVRYGSFLGLGARPIAVPVDAMVLLGQDMEIVAYKPNELRRFPTFSAAGTTPIPTDAIIKVGLAKPSHCQPGRAKQSKSGPRLCDVKLVPARTAVMTGKGRPWEPSSIQPDQPHTPASARR